jgi:hypothetical protein
MNKVINTETSKEKVNAVIWATVGFAIGIVVAFGIVLVAVKSAEKNIVDKTQESSAYTVDMREI